MSSIAICDSGGRTARHQSSKKSDGFPFHALCSNKELCSPAGFAVYLQRKKEGIEELRGLRRIESMIVSQMTHLVMVWCCYENDRAISGDVEGAPRTYLPEEDTCDDAPEDERGLVGQVGRKRERFLMVRHADVGETSRAMRVEG
jgi:hypothetical protein